MGPLLAAKGEEPAPVQVGSLHEGQQGVVVFLGLARVADDEVGAQGGFGLDAADVGNALQEALAVAPPPHAAHQRGRYVLEGQVEVRDAGGTDGGHEPVGQVRRVQVQQADPVHQVGYRLDQRHDGPLALPLVAAVGGEVLGYQHHLAGVQGIHFIQDGGRRPAALRTTEGGDGAEPARPITPLGDLHVGPRAGRCRTGQV